MGCSSPRRTRSRRWLLHAEPASSRPRAPPPPARAIRRRTSTPRLRPRQPRRAIACSASKRSTARAMRALVARPRRGSRPFRAATPLAETVGGRCPRRGRARGRRRVRRRRGRRRRGLEAAPSGAGRMTRAVHVAAARRPPARARSLPAGALVTMDTLRRPRACYARSGCRAPARFCTGRRASASSRRRASRRACAASSSWRRLRRRAACVGPRRRRGRRRRRRRRQRARARRGRGERRDG